MQSPPPPPSPPHSNSAKVQVGVEVTFFRFPVAQLGICRAGWGKTGTAHSGDVDRCCSEGVHGCEGEKVLQDHPARHGDCSGWYIGTRLCPPPGASLSSARWPGTVHWRGAAPKQHPRLNSHPPGISNCFCNKNPAQKGRGAGQPPPPPLAPPSTPSPPPPYPLPLKRPPPPGASEPNLRAACVLRFR